MSPITKTLKKDHAKLREFLRVLGDENEEIGRKKNAFEEMSPVFHRHFSAEEHVIYSYMGELESLSRIALEAEEDHHLLEQMEKELKTFEEKDKWLMKMRIFSEILSHHLKEEDEKIFPKLDTLLKKNEAHRLKDEYIAYRDNGGKLSGTHLQTAHLPG